MDTPTDRPTQPDPSPGAARADAGTDPATPPPPPPPLPVSEPPLKHHGDALLDESGTRHGESPPRVEPDAGT